MGLGVLDYSGVLHQPDRLLSKAVLLFSIAAGWFGYWGFIILAGQNLPPLFSYEFSIHGNSHVNAPISIMWCKTWMWHLISQMSEIIGELSDGFFSSYKEKILFYWKY